MKENMSSKKKIVIAASIVGVVLLAAIISVVAVLAAATQTVTSSINVTYSVSDVSAKVTASYAVEDFYIGVEEGENKFGTGAVSLGEATFNTTEGTATKTLTSAQPTALTSTYDYITFEYSFENNSTLAYNVTCKLTTEEGAKTLTAENMTLYYLVVNEEIADADWGTQDVTSEDSDWVEFTVDSGIPMFTVEGKVEDTDTESDTYGKLINQTGSVKYVYVRAVITDTAKAASLTGSVAWNLASAS